MRDIAIICSSASTFKALLKTYLPKVWGSSQGPSSNPRLGYDKSQSGQFVMKPFGASSNNSNSNRKYGVSDTGIGDDSEEAIIPQGISVQTKIEIDNPDPPADTHSSRQEWGSVK